MSNTAGIYSGNCPIRKQARIAGVITGIVTGKWAKPAAGMRE